MKLVGHGKIPLTSYEIDGKHPISIEVDVYLDDKGQIKLFYNKTKDSKNFLIIKSIE